jgi:exocyst complex component 4
MIKADAPINVKYLSMLVQCLSMLGKVAAAGAVIWYLLSPNLLYFLIISTE